MFCRNYMRIRLILTIMCVMCWIAVPVAGATPDDERLQALEREVAELRAAIEELRAAGLAEERLAEIERRLEILAEEVENLKVGDSVVVHYIISCGRCKQCIQGNDNRCRNRVSIGAHIDGGFAEYIAIPARNAFKLPPNLTFEEGAIIGCAVSTPFHALAFSPFRARW